MTTRKKTTIPIGEMFIHRDELISLVQEITVAVSKNYKLNKKQRRIVQEFLARF